jgi:hypothetical protein
MSVDGWLSRWLVVGVCLSCMPGGAGCRRSEGKAEHQKKPIPQLSADDLRKVVVSLGFQTVTATTSKSGDYANLTVIGLKESADGEEGADGKKRLRLLVSVHEDPEDSAPRAATLDKVGAVYKRDGRHTLTVELSNRDREEAKKILDMIVE